LFFNRGEQFSLDGFPVGAQVRGIDSIAVVVERICGLDLDDEKPREVLRTFRLRIETILKAF
jgi:hypothetical protein